MTTNQNIDANHIHTHEYVYTHTYKYICIHIYTLKYTYMYAFKYTMLKYKRETLNKGQCSHIVLSSQKKDL